jgi:hypothetical protein
MTPDGNIEAAHAHPNADGHLITKAYGDANYGGGGGGDYLPLAGGTMVGDILMKTDASGKRFIGFTRNNGTFKAGIGNQTTAEEFEITLANAAGDTYVSNLKLIPDGNARLEHAAPAHDNDIVTKGYGDTHYLAGSGGGDFYADGHVPMTGNFTMNAPSSGLIFSRILRSDGTLKLAYGSRSTVNQFELLLANITGDAEINKLILKPDGNISASFANPAADEDLVTKGYGDTHYLSGGGGGDFYADGHVPMTGNFQGGGHKITTIANGTANTDGVNVSQLAEKLDITATAADSAKLGGIDAANFFQESEFISASTGSGDSGKPIVLDATGQIDPSMIDVSVFYYVGEFTPASGTEYPDTTGETYGAFWVVQALTGDYTFAGGDLAGRTISNGDFMVWAAAGWSIMAGEMNPTLYYKLDGTQALTEPFAGGGKQLKNIAEGVDPSDAATVSQLGTGGGGDFMADGSVPMTGHLRFAGEAEAANSNIIEMNRPDGTAKIYMGTQTGVERFDLYLYLPDGATPAAVFELINDGNVRATYASPAHDKDLITKEYGDANYGGGGGGDFMADGSVPMTGVMSMNAPVSGAMYTRIARNDGTLKIAYGSRDTANQFEIFLANMTGDAEINRFIMKADGNISAAFASPAANDDLITKEYGDTHYAGGGGDFMADGSVPMTGDMLMNADAGGSRAIQIRRSDGTLKCALGSWSDAEELELLLADTAGTTEVARLLMRADGNVAAPDASPSQPADLVTRAYGDANYGGGGGGAETVYDMGAGTEINATNGTMLKKTLTTNTTFTIALSAGESITLHLRGGDAHTATLPVGTLWVGDRPTALTAHDVFIIWNDGADNFASYSGAVT